jgi:hypothetical protein
VPMARFATWTRSDGLSIDPWIRAHERMGAAVLAPCPRSMVMTGTVAEWESWTDMVFPKTGAYVVSDALGRSTSTGRRTVARTSSKAFGFSTPEAAGPLLGPAGLSSVRRRRRGRRVGRRQRPSQL